MARVELHNIVKSYGGQRVVNGIDLVIEEGQFVVLLGPSGCGKTTTLRMIAGLEQITAGEMHFDGRLMNHEPPERRGVGMVFQNYALYPHMTVAENLSFGLESQRGRGSRRKARAQERARVLQVARLLEIDHVLDHRPKELSGGQRQRAALGRALVREPDVFLLDEPLSNLDANLREKMRMELSRLHDEMPVTTVYVTHDQGEALTLADQLVVMDEGKICQAGQPGEVYSKPGTTFVAGFLGSPGMNLWELPGAPSSDAAASGGVYLAGEACGEHVSGEDPVVVGVRPEHLKLVPEGELYPARVDCRVDAVENLGSHVLVHAKVQSSNQGSLVAKLETSAGLRRGDRVAFGARAEHVHLFDARTGQRLGHRLARERTSAGV
jgi:ABC-type sugar transport system ATPase subunit